MEGEKAEYYPDHPEKAPLFTEAFIELYNYRNKKLFLPKNFLQGWEGVIGNYAEWKGNATGSFCLEEYKSGMSNSYPEDESESDIPIQSNVF